MTESHEPSPEEIEAALKHIAEVDRWNSVFRAADIDALSDDNRQTFEERFREADENLERLALEERSIPAADLEAARQLRAATQGSAENQAIADLHDLPDLPPGNENTDLSDLIKAVEDLSVSETPISLTEAKRAEFTKSRDWFGKAQIFNRPKGEQPK
jgi:succinate dehydrogenase flavin-adding protein (antitoxin of CptAB toxin-antitoxin module)